MQSDIVQDDSCKDKSVENNSGQVSVDLGFEGNMISEGMEIDNVKEGDLIAKNDNNTLDGKRVSENNEVNEGEKGFNGACISMEVKDSEKSGKIESFENPVNDKDDSKVIQSEKMVDEGPGEKEGFLEDQKGENMEECERNEEKEDREKKPKFRVSDLVWGKVRSHPWWPGQILDPKDASDKAKKHSKSKAYLVGYFGDKTFAWNDESNLKPFVPNFSEMVKQTSLKAFQHALGCVLDEISSRVEFSLSCGCIANDVYDQFKTQVIENPGIQEQSRILQRENMYVDISFEPVKFFDYVKNLALGPQNEVNRLDNVIRKAEMVSFYRWKGIYHLAEFGSLIGYVNNEADSLVKTEKEKCETSSDESPLVETIKDLARTKKRKISSEKGDSSRSNKKVKRDSDMFGKKSGSKKIEREIGGKSGSKFSSSSGKKRKEGKLVGNESENRESRSSEKTMEVRDLKSPFRIGERFLKVASQLSQPSPLLKSDESSGKTSKQKKRKDSKK